MQSFDGVEHLGQYEGVLEELIDQEGTRSNITESARADNEEDTRVVAAASVDSRRRTQSSLTDYFQNVLPAPAVTTIP